MGRPIDADAFLRRVQNQHKRYSDEEMRRQMWWFIHKWLPAALADEPTVDVPQWIPVTPETMPESGVAVLLCCERTYCCKASYRYICDGQYIAKHTEIVGNAADDLAVEYDEETDEYYLLEGFYERINNWDEYGSVVIPDSVTHWMPMPQLPEVTQCEND